MEAFTSGLVSADARTAYLEDRPWMRGAFSGPVRHRGKYGYRMHAFESQIAMARACGRGRRSGRQVPQHPFDKKENPCPISS